MALLRKDLKEFGLDSEAIDKIIGLHTETVSALKDEIDTIKTKSKDYDKVSKELETTKTKLENMVDKAELDTVKTEFDSYKSTIASKETLAKKKEAYLGLLKENKVSEKAYDKAIKLANFEEIEIDETGKIKDTEIVSTNIKNEWADFVVTEKTKGLDTATPPKTTSEIKQDMNAFIRGK